MQCGAKIFWNTTGTQQLRLTWWRIMGGLKWTTIFYSANKLYFMLRKYRHQSQSTIWIIDQGIIDDSLVLDSRQHVLSEKACIATSIISNLCWPSPSTNSSSKCPPSISLHVEGQQILHMTRCSTYLWKWGTAAGSPTSSSARTAAVVAAWIETSFHNEMLVWMFS